MPRTIYSFTLPLGAQLNKDGTAVMLGAVLLFTAQAAGVEFAPAAFLTILLVGLLLSEGSGGIPGGGLIRVADADDAGVSHECSEMNAYVEMGNVGPSAAPACSQQQLVRSPRCG